MIHVRRYTDADVAALAGLLGDLGYPTTVTETRERLARMTPDYYHTLVAEDEGAVVGFIGLMILPVYEYPEPVGWILALSVGADQRRGGVGRTLMAAAEALAAEHGVKDVRLHSGLHRAQAHSFYEALGYDRNGFRFRREVGG